MIVVLRCRSVEPNNIGIGLDECSEWMMKNECVG